MKVLNLFTKLAVFLAIVAILSILAYTMFGQKVFEKASPLIGRDAPDFTLTQFNGQEIKLSELRGKTVLLNFWASWCGPCRQEAPALESSWERYKDKPVIFIGVNVWDDRDDALSYIQEFGGGFINGIDQKGEIAVNYGVAGVPETYFITPEGKIAFKYTGTLTEPLVDQFLAKALPPAHGGLSKKEESNDLKHD